MGFGPTGQWVDESFNPLAGPPKRLPGDPDSPTTPLANPYAGKTASDLALTLGTSGIGGMSARELEMAIASGWIAPELAQQALVMKDAWAQAAKAASAGAGGGGGQAPSPWSNAGIPQYGLANNLAYQADIAQNPGNADAWANWYNQLTKVWPTQSTQSVMGWQPQVLPQQYRQPAAQYLQSQGLRPTGSLGQYGYTNYQQPTTPVQFSPEMLNSITDENLRKWMQYYMSASGMIPGSYTRPAA